MINVYSPYNLPQRGIDQKKNATKAVGKWFFYIAILGAVGFGLNYYFSGRGEDIKIELTAKKGTVEYRESEKEKWKEVSKIPLELDNSYEIRTLSDGEASFSGSDGSKIKIGSYSRIVLSSLQGKINWVQTDGDSHHQVGKDSRRKEYKVAMSDGEIVSQSTAFEMKVKETDTFVYVLEGEVSANYKDKSNQTAKAGEKIIINPLGKRVVSLESEDLKETWTNQKIEEDLKENLPIDKTVLDKINLSVGSEASSSGNGNNEAQNNNPSGPNSNESISVGESKINLNIKDGGKGVLLEWTEAEGDFENWKVLRGTQSEITYPNDSYRTVPKNTKSYLWENPGDGKEYFYKICAFKNDKGCISYSDSKSITLPKTNEGDSSENDNVSASQSVTPNESDSSSSQQNTENKPAKSGVTTRGKCEGSGGHWNESSKVCKCPSSEVFIGGKCKKQ